MRFRPVVSCLLVVLAMAGCATPYRQGQAALRLGRYDEAAAHFDQVLARDPDRLDALAGRGIARYKQGAFDKALESLNRVVAQNPQDATARLYLALSYLRKGDALGAEDQLTSLRSLGLDSRLATEVDRALDVIRLEPLTPPIRAFVATSLESQAELLQELREARLSAERVRYYAPPVSCIFIRHHGALFCN